MKIVTIDVCPACESNLTNVVFKPTSQSWERFQLLSTRKYKGCMDSWGDFLNLQVNQCSLCNHLWHQTQPEFSDLMKMYDSSIPLHDIPVSHYPSQAILASMRSLFKLSSRVSNGTPTFLDYGSGRGKWSKAAVIAGFRVWAYEPSVTRSSERITENFVIVNNLEELLGLSFDVVNLEQVLEHTQNPYETLKGLSPYLKVNSLVRIVVPNVSQSMRKTLWNDFPFPGNSMHVLSPYEHLQGFNGISLKMLLGRVDFKHVNTIGAWIAYPRVMVRFVIGILFPKFSGTSVLVTPDFDILSSKN